MYSFITLFILTLPILPLSAPLRRRDASQALFIADGTDVESTTTSVQDASTTPPPSTTTIRFSPDDASPSTQPTSSHKGDDTVQSKPIPIVAAYYPDWTASQLPPEMVDFDLLDWIDFAFAVPDSTTFTPKFLEADSEDLLHRLVTAARAKNKNVKLSIGGWTGSGHFSDAVNATNRNALAQDIVTLYHEFNLDGIDIDWEYPGEEGAPGNVYTPADSVNFLAFLQLLRSLLPSGARISAATQVWPFMDSNGEKMKDVSAFAQVLDWVLLMNYDVWGSSPNPGANAPLSDGCHNSSQPEANAHAAIHSWTAAGFPADQIMLGLPAYGYVSRSTATNLRTRRSTVDTPSHFDRTPISTVATNDGDSLDSTTGPGTVTVMSDTGSPDSGQVQFNALIAQGALVRNTPGDSPTFVGAGGFERNWDVCSSTPFLRSTSSGQIITYDDPDSLSAKAAFAQEAGILGVNMWDAHGDTQQWDLIGGIRRGLGVA